MKMFLKRIAFALVAATLFSLCLTPAAFATEELPAATPSDAENKKPPAAMPSDAENNEKPPAATPSDAEEIPEKIELFTAMFFDTVEDTVSTGEELEEWLSAHKNTGGTVKLADDIILGDFYYARGMRAAAVTVDTGEFSITADGYVYLQATSPLTIRGGGGKQGVLRASGEGSLLHLNGLVLEAENGCAAFQEEGAGLILENTSVSGAIHYAKQPFVCEQKSPLAVVGREETLDAGMLPGTLSVRVNRQGQVTPYFEEVPVTWDLSGHEEDQKLRRRFTVIGAFQDMASQAAPVCTVAYDDFPLTFLEVDVMKMAGTHGDSYRFNGTFSKPEDRLPITVAQEYSFDGEKWTLYDEQSVTAPSQGFTIIPYVRKEDQASVSELFIRLRWNDDKTVYYSNVLRFAADSLEVNEEPGGNRGGGTDIIDPPEPPETDSNPGTVLPPETDPDPGTVLPPETSAPTPNRPDQGGTNHGSGGKGNGGTGLKPKPMPGPASEMSPDLTSESTPEPVPEPALSGETAISADGPSASAPEPEKDRKPAKDQGFIPDAEDEIQEAPLSARQPDAPDASAQMPVPPSSKDSAEISAEPEPENSAEISAEPEPENVPRGPDALPIAAGLAAVAVCMGGAAFYLHPPMRKKLLRKLRNLFRR